MLFSIVDDEQIGTVLEIWEELLYNAEEFAYWDEGDLDQELFRKAMFLTWKLFSERIDFDASEEEYALPVDLAVILGQIMSYGRLKQIIDREDGGNIELSAMLAEDLWKSIQFRKEFSRFDPVISSKHLINMEVYQLTYNLKSGQLYVQKGNESFTVKDISAWWDFDEE